MINKTSIAILSDGVFPFTIGGIQKHSYLLTKYLARHKLFVDLFHFESIDQKTLKCHFSIDELNQINFIKIKKPILPRFPGHYIFSSYLFSKALYLNILEKKYDVIYAQGLTSFYFLKKDPFRKELISKLVSISILL